MREFFQQLIWALKYLESSLEKATILEIFSFNSQDKQTKSPLFSTVYNVISKKLYKKKSLGTLGIELLSLEWPADNLRWIYNIKDLDPGI